MFRKKRYFNSKGLKKPQIDYINAETDNLKNFIPNFGIVETDENGNNVLDKVIYKLEQDSTGQLVQKTNDYLIKAKSHQPRLIHLRLMTLLKLKHTVSIEHRAHCYYSISTEPLFLL